MTNTEELLHQIRSAVIGRTELMEGPFGPRPVVYADYTASGRALSFVEDYIAQVVLPLYANTHTESSGTGRQTTLFREEARELIARSVGADDDHVVLFCGSGTTAAIDKLVGVLGLRLPSALDDAYSLSDHIPPNQRPVVFIGPYEHHSNELPWRESIADVIVIGEDADGHVDLAQLESELKRHHDRPRLIGSFSAASNVTGIVTDTSAVSSLLHRYGALALWDFAAAAPYVDIDMAAEDGAHLDAIFLSPHKFIGGPGTPGLLVARRELFTNRVPDVPGGGTVAYVNPGDHDYLAQIELREEGGTPDIVGAIRAGLVFQLKDAVGVETIRDKEDHLLELATTAWSSHPNIEVLGNLAAERLSIVSFVVRDPTEGEHPRYLHHNFVVALLNDLFGIQSRGGCSCAGPYGHRLLGIDIERSHQFQREISRGCEGIKPGWVRINFNYFIDDATHRYIVDAVSLIADHGAELLPYYRFEPDTGIWTHRDGLAAPAHSLADMSYAHGRPTFAGTPPNDAVAIDTDDLLAQAARVLDQARAANLQPLDRLETTADFEALRWFPYHEAFEPAD